MIELELERKLHSEQVEIVESVGAEIARIRSSLGLIVRLAGGQMIPKDLTPTEIAAAWEKKKAEKKRRRTEARRQGLTDDIMEKMYGKPVEETA